MDAVVFAQVVDGLIAGAGVAAHHVVLPVLDDGGQGLLNIGVVVVPSGVGQGGLEGVVPGGGEVVQPGRVELAGGLLVVGQGLQRPALTGGVGFLFDALDAVQIPVHVGGDISARNLPQLCLDSVGAFVVHCV